MKKKNENIKCNLLVNIDNENTTIRVNGVGSDVMVGLTKLLECLFRNGIDKEDMIKAIEIAEDLYEEK